VTRPVNLYALSRIHGEEAFNRVERHQSQREENTRIQFHEIESLRRLVDALIARGVSLRALDGFFFGYHIPRIGKEFDLLKFSEKSCLNIELKSQPVPEEQIRSQLLRNRHYLSHLGTRLNLYTVVTDTLTCYKLTLAGELAPAEADELAEAVHRRAGDFSRTVDEFFRASEYLVSPLTTPGKFIQGEYFLTQAQEQVKKSVLRGVEEAEQGAFFHITGRPGTGKTLLGYDIAKELSRSGKTLIVHCGALCPEQERIGREIANLRLASAQRLEEGEFSLEEYSFLFVDEAHRISETGFARLTASVRKNRQVCIFSTDPEQVLSTAEKTRDIPGKIRTLPLAGEFLLSEKLRANKELHAFILCLKNLALKPKLPARYPNVELCCANTTAEAQNLLAYYREKGYVFINYAASPYSASPYADYEEVFDPQRVIGREFDQVVMLLDDTFYYDENGLLQGVPCPDMDLLYPNLFYQGVTRVREKLALIVVRAPALFEKISGLLA